MRKIFYLVSSEGKTKKKNGYCNLPFQECKAGELRTFIYTREGSSQKDRKQMLQRLPKKKKRKKKKKEIYAYNGGIEIY